MKKEMTMSEFLGRYSYTIKECKKIIAIYSVLSIPMTLYLIKYIRSYLTNDK